MEINFTGTEASCLPKVLSAEPRALQALKEDQTVNALSQGEPNEVHTW